MPSRPPGERSNCIRPAAAIIAALVIIYQLFGDDDAYRGEAQVALELDRRTPHEDKKLPPALRQKLEAAAKGSRQGK